MKNLLVIFAVLFGIYLLTCTLLYFFQGKMIFFPQSLAKDFTFQFDQNFEERYVEMEDGKILHSLLFKVDKPKGVVFICMVMRAPWKTGAVLQKPSPI